MGHARRFPHTKHVWGPGYFFYDGSINRALSVDSRAILEGLRKVYDAALLVDEILGKTGSSITAGGAR